MRKQIIALLTIVAVFGIAIAAYAYSQNQTAGPDKSCCSKGGDSCPMKAKGHEDKGEHAGMSCDKMKGHGSEHAKAEGHESCGCCGDSCPMKGKVATTTATSVVAGEATKSCCDSCECCKGKDEAKSDV